MLLRLAFIFFLAGYYRLDKYLPIPFWLRLLWLPVMYIPYFGKANLVCCFFEVSGPAFIKLGQFLSMRDDFLPKEFVSQLEKLQDQCTSIGAQKIIAEIEQSFNCHIQSIFPDFDAKPIATASLAQVHNIGSTNNCPMVIKVLKPNILKQLKRDLELIEIVTRVIAKSMPDFPIMAMFDQYKTRTIAECDFRQEAARTEKMRINALKHNYIEFAKIDWERTNGAVITMTKLDAIRLNNTDLLIEQGVNLQQLAINGTKAFFQQVLFDNFFHGDMHHGNIMVKKGAKAQFSSFDCAVSGSLEQSEINLFAEILWLLSKRKYELLAKLLHSCGWVKPNIHWTETEVIIMSYFEPIADKPIGELNLSALINDLVKQIHRYGFVLQPNFALLLKTFAQIESLGRRLFPSLDFWTIVREQVGMWRKLNHQQAIIQQQISDKLLLTKIIGPQLIDQVISDYVAKKQSPAGAQQENINPPYQTQPKRYAKLFSYILLFSWVFLVIDTQFLALSSNNLLPILIQNGNIEKIVLIMWGITLVLFSSITNNKP